MPAFQAFRATAARTTALTTQLSPPSSHHSPERGSASLPAEHVPTPASARPPQSSGSKCYRAMPSHTLRSLRSLLTSQASHHALSASPSRKSAPCLAHPLQPRLLLLPRASNCHVRPTWMLRHHFPCAVRGQPFYRISTRIASAIDRHLTALVTVRLYQRHRVRERLFPFLLLPQTPNRPLSTPSYALLLRTIV